MQAVSLATTWSRSIGIEVPIVNAPMGGAAGGRLAAAVSAAGGLGMIGMGSSATADQLTAELAQLDGRIFGIGLVHWVVQDRPDLFEVALAARPALLSVSFGEDWEWVRRAHEAGLTVTTQIATVDAARRAVDAGVDVVVARGAEGGGHGEPTLGTLPLLADVLDAIDVPVLAAGGVSSARAVAAVLAAGAGAAWVGTAFAACSEALTPSPARDALIAADGDATELTTEHDVAAGYRWPPSIPERVLRGSPVNAGQGVGAVRREESAAELVRSLAEGAERLLRRWH
ncbi:NAD(P)H-dependent flavin oxidoreductase [Mycolicibacterium fortuitum]|uniref:Nitronate monooxygenase n=1 Tax=Mycolicibacterium fortuitum TaxID=1766 RepID=A0AAE4VGK1_MYCFO|nr:nitronate monooxygenase [Mycolicibacterium fortuitum]MCA4753794.1 nitronate monooxygenase [Mycolicibacterium fortuitum]MCV7141301.1 nitronate monooxygenase [Mycolicibacterium fortuitum]MDG5774521.1 nitronate monooxygenase [Mycolicibacterium fortuitum]MDG5783906.1 nitronate monooxygenase [Mycolicibacterium fortuitum]MDV7192024.1 nitronate monooxygenase [Mycolicibacterium fortuitum]